MSTVHGPRRLRRGRGGSRAGSGSSPTGAAGAPAVDHRQALAGEDEEPLLGLLGVVQAAGLPGLQDLDGDAEMPEAGVGRFEAGAHAELALALPAPASPTLTTNHSELTASRSQATGLSRPSVGVSIRPLMITSRPSEKRSSPSPMVIFSPSAAIVG